MVQKIRVSSDNKSQTAIDDLSMAINLHLLTGKTAGISLKQRNHSSSSKEKFMKSSSSRKSKRTFPFSSRVGGTAAAIWGSNDGVGREMGGDGVGSGREAETEGLDLWFGSTASWWVVVIDELWAERNGTRIHGIVMKVILISCRTSTNGNIFWIPKPYLQLQLKGEGQMVRIFLGREKESASRSNH